MDRLLFMFRFCLTIRLGVAADFYYQGCKVEDMLYKHSDAVLEISSRCQHCYCLQGLTPCIKTDCSRLFPDINSCTDSNGKYLSHGDVTVEEIPCYCVDGIEYCIDGNILKPRYPKRR